VTPKDRELCFVWTNFAVSEVFSYISLLITILFLRF